MGGRGRHKPAPLGWAGTFVVRERPPPEPSVEVMGRYLNPSDQGEHLLRSSGWSLQGLRRRFIEPLGRFIAGSSLLR
jgi:hypothetical protein